MADPARGPVSDGAPRFAKRFAPCRARRVLGQFVIVRLVVSHLDDPDTNGLVLVNTTSHETLAVASTVTVWLVVDRFTGDAALFSVNVSAGRSTVPVQSLPACSVNESVPLIGRRSPT